MKQWNVTDSVKNEQYFRLALKCYLYKLLICLNFEALVCDYFTNENDLAVLSRGTVWWVKQLDYELEISIAW